MKSFSVSRDLTVRSVSKSRRECDGAGVTKISYDLGQATNQTNMAIRRKVVMRLGAKYLSPSVKSARIVQQQEIRIILG